uniref:PABS domain-containing protein n=1 Tax=Schizophyllum commune (strain H4-8 / FGSC 9210) TaxID=578458 RepID=D8PS35_SCHCM
MGVSPFKLILAASGIVTLSLVVFLYERALTPIFAYGPTTAALNQAVIGGLLAASLQPWKMTSRAWLNYIVFVYGIAPKATYYVPVWLARWKKDPVAAPHMSHMAVLNPLILVLASAIMQAVVRCSTFLLSKTLTLCQFISIAVAAAAIRNITSTFDYEAIQRAAEGQVKAKGSKKKQAPPPPFFLKLVSLVVLFAGARVLFPILRSPVLPHPLEKPYTHPEYPLRIHSSVQSDTGLIVVGEALALPEDQASAGAIQDVRYLRASHSLLGGVYVGSHVYTLNGTAPLRDSFGAPLGDSIYATFNVQEAVRLLDLGTDTPSALVIGLGIGMSTTAFMRHGVSTTIIEIDPEVYRAARTYFGLPDPGKDHVFLEDARAWVERRAAQQKPKDAFGDNTSTELFDFVVHDCFSGGGVPQHLYTVEFLQQAKRIMTPEGKLVLNFVGIVDSEATRLVYFTLLSQFKQCRAFHDMDRPMTEEKYKTEFLNMVFFCTSADEPLAFRNATSQDFLGSYMRHKILTTIEQREVNLGYLKADAEEQQKYILTDAHNPLGKLQEEQGGHHWEVMRMVLPDVFWETY